jgi:RNA polymerase sigma factor (sigma-70 family)
MRRLRAARSSGAVDEAKRIQFVLAAKMRRDVARRVRRKMADCHADDAVGQVEEAAGRRLFHGNTLREFKGWLNSIAGNKVCDHYRDRSRAPESASLDKVPERAILGCSETDSPGAAELRHEIEAVLDCMRPDHREVVRLSLRGFRASEVAERNDGMSTANVHQILSRFRKQLRERL